MPPMATGPPGGGDDIEHLGAIQYVAGVTVNSPYSVTTSIRSVFHSIALAQLNFIQNRVAYSPNHRMGTDIAVDHLT